MYHIFLSIHPLMEIGLFSCIGYCEKFCDKHESSWLVKILFSFPLGMYSEMQLLYIIIDLFLFFEETPYYFP